MVKDELWSISRYRDILIKKERIQMPTLARFYGIVIRMYFLGSEHNPPHIHAIYGEDTAAFDINSGEEIDGSLPTRAAGMVREWIEIHQTELLDMWETQEFKKIDPLV
ncbi:DUF4160 domain-containing protein [Lancefieldella parvula]|uniref:DUF4160 domain-containing protein n=2 Tax=Lancefieldella TaxID=2767353 RepID=UPI0028D11F51|nr:DUF4160 domain-containing protein [Lancefieldella parvula]